MTVLPAGTFKVSEYRKGIPDAVMREILKRYQADHRPALSARDYDTEAGDFIPPQNDPRFIFLIETPEHNERTFGRKRDAEKTVTTRGSDIGEGTRTRDMRDTGRLHQAALAQKRGDQAAAAALRGSIEKKSRLKPKQRIPQRKDPWGRKRKRKQCGRRRS